MANELNIGVKFGAEGIQEIQNAINGLTGGLQRSAGRIESTFNAAGDAALRAGKAVERFKNGLRDPSSAASLEKLAKAFDTPVRSIEDLEAELGDLQRALRKSTDPVQMKALGDQIDRLQTGISNIKVVAFQERINKAGQAAAQAASNLKKLTPGANEATFALVNLSRVAQDAPFGFIGIANNINPLLESFQRLKQQTGSTQSAFKALFSSLGGAGGLGLTVGILTAGLTLLGQGFFSGGRAAKKAKEDVDEFKKALEEAASGAARDASRVTTLFNALTSGSLNVEERKKALDELKSINKEFFGSLREEQGIINGLEKAYDGYLDKILQIGKAKAIESQLTKLFDQKIQLELSIDPKFLGQTNSGIQQAIGKLQTQLEKLGGAVSTKELEKEVNLLDKNNQNLNKRIALQQKIEQLQKGILVEQNAGVGAVKNQIENIELQIKGLSKLQQANGEFNLQTDKGNKKEEDALKKRLAALEKIRDATKDISIVADLQEQIFDLQVKITLRDAAKNGLSKEETDLAIQGFRNQLTEAFNREVLALEAIPKVSFSRVELAPLTPQQLNALATGTKELIGLSGLAKSGKDINIESDRAVKIRLLGLEFVLAQEEAQKAVDRLKETIVNGAIDTLSSTADAFGQVLAGAFSGKGIGEAFAKGAQGILGSIGGVLQEVGKQVVATSTLIKSLRAALDKLFLPGGASLGIIAGLGLIALGGLLKNIKIPGFADGVTNFSGGLAWVGERGKELVRLPRGSDVIPNHMLNSVNPQPIILQPSVRFAGKDMYVMLQRVTESNKTVGGGTL